MSVRAYYDVWCDADDCLLWCEGATASTPRQARRNAARMGWTYSRKHGDRCKHHIPEGVTWEKPDPEPLQPGERVVSLAEIRAQSRD